MGATFDDEIRLGRAKNRGNSIQHGLRFEDAEQVFSGPCVTFVDDRLDYGEERLVTLGLLAGRLVVIAHTPRDEGSRIISMRKGSRREKEIYQKRLGAP
ncbi:MAG: BrnT family toxin [Candidatus Binataceae bacterium]